MIGTGEQVPEARVWAGADDRRGTTVAALAKEGPFLLLFYLYDWTST